MILAIEAASPVPPYEQIRTQVASMVRLGLLERGARLPSIRQLANDLGLAGGTVARAYRELESDGVVRTRGRHGTVVAASAGSTRALAAGLGEAARAFADEARRLGADEAETVAALRSALADIKTTGRTT